MNTIRTVAYYAAGEWKRSTSGNHITINCPFKNEAIIGQAQAMTKDEINRVIDDAHTAQPDWNRLPIRERCAILNDWADHLLTKKDELAHTMMLEIAKPHTDCVKEVVRTADLIRYTAEEALHLHGESMRGDLYPGGNRNKIAVVERAPLGVVLAISPFNYPVNLSAAKIAPALVAGNTVVFKPATQGTMSAAIMIEALSETNIPPNVCQFVTGRGREIGDILVTHPSIACISFTGGTETGMDISRKAGLIPQIYELGGKDPAIILDDADLPFAVEQIVSGAFAYSGQRCTAIKRVFATDETMNQLVPLLDEKIRALTVGTPEDNNTIVPVISTSSADYIMTLVQDALEKGATVVCGGERDGLLIQPTLLDYVTPAMRIAWEEPFGPVLPLIRIANDAEAISLSNASAFGLQASIFSRDFDRAMHIADQLDTGSVQLNSRTERGPDHFPFLGTKHSGMGVQGIRGSIESMSRPRITVFNMRSFHN
ncbi:MAG: NADP-dependent glyceraldehyde-3-phosphate dehydrogenase [Bacilli bacterium]